MRRRRLEALFWIAIYISLSLLPLLLIGIGERPPGRDFWTELSVALGFVGLAMIGLQFAITARFQRIAAPFGLDIMLRFHRQISLFAVGLVVAHPLILFVAHPQHLELLNPAAAPWRARAGLLALLALLFLVAMSVWRVPLKIPYETWRVLHGALAIAAIAFALFHVIGVAHYLALTWKRALWAFMGAGAIGLLAYVRVFKPFSMMRRPYTLEEVVPERGDSYSLVLKPIGHAGRPFRPGQFAWLTILHSPLSIREHPFSFSSSALRPERPSFTVKELGDFTRQVKYLPTGTPVYLDGPYGDFSVDLHAAHGYVFIAGGVGITPIMSTLRTLAERADALPLLLFYASRTWDDATFRDEIEQLSRRLELKVVYVIEEPPDDWDGEEGFLNVEILGRHLPENRDELRYFVCGPPPMLDAVDAALGELEIPIGLVHMELFNLV